MKFDIPQDRTTRIRVKSSGQVLDAIPAVARAMLYGGTADMVDPKTGEILEGAAAKAAPETARIDPAGERAVAPAQTAPPKGKARSGR